MRLYWECPKCKSIVDFTEQMQDVFSEETVEGYEADFMPESGLYFHTIDCPKCDNHWSVSISEMFSL